MNGLAEHNVRKRPYVKGSQKLALGIGDFGYSMVSCTIATYIMSFGTMAVGVPATLMGIAIAIGTIFDAVSDPIIGYLSDRGKNRFFGKRLGYVLFGLLLMSVNGILIWSVPMSMGNFGKFLWFAIGLTMLRTWNTLYYTPVGAFSVEISNDYNERTNIQAIRSIFYIIGMILPVVLMGIFQNRYAIRNEAGEVIVKGQFFVQGYVDFAYIASAICLVTTVIIFVMVYSNIPRMRIKQEQEEVRETAERQKGGLKKVLMDFFAVLKNKDMRYIIFGYAISMISATLIITLGFHVFTFTFTTSTLQMYILMGGLLVMTIAGQPIWMKLSKKYDKKRTMLLGLCISLAGCVMIFFMFLFRDTMNTLMAKGTAYVAIMLPPLMIAGLGTGVLYSMPLALIGDIIVKNKSQNQGENTGTYAGMMTFSYKVSQALTQLMAGLMLDVIGFQEGSSVQTESTAIGLGWVLCVGIILAVTTGILIFSRLKVDKEEITRLMEEDEVA